MSSADAAAQHEKFMRAALAEARLAEEEQEVPVGAVVVRGDRIIGRGHNQRERLHDPTAHAEMIALTAASAYLRQWRLSDCIMYVTLEPCPMCAGALIQARIARVVFGTHDPKAGACGTLYQLHDDPRLNHRMEVTAGVLEEACRELLVRFFLNRRRANNGD